MSSARPPAHRGGPVRRSVLVLAGLLAAAGAAGCASPVSVTAARYATDPVCASVVLALPRDLGEMRHLRTTSQATAAWGDPTDPVVLRCGVEPLGPTTDRCVTVDDGTTSVDWVVVPGDSAGTGAAGGSSGAPWRFTTYGRVPAVEVLVPASVTSTRSTSFLVDLGPAIAIVPQTRSCV